MRYVSDAAFCLVCCRVDRAVLGKENVYSRLIHSSTHMYEENNLKMIFALRPRLGGRGDLELREGENVALNSPWQKVSYI